MTVTHQLPDEVQVPRSDLLLEFLRDNEASCPVCGYNVHALRQPVCPECRHELVLTVGVSRPRTGWLLAAVAPGFFSGLCAVFLLIPIVGRVWFGDGRWSYGLMALDLFGFCSGMYAVRLAIRNRRFTMLLPQHQRVHAVAIWAIHVLALVMLILAGVYFM